MLKILKKIIFKVNNSRLSLLTKYFFSSSGYKIATQDSIKNNFLIDNSWNRKASLKQFKTWKSILNRSPNRADLNALKKALELATLEGSNLCEIGCGSAYLADFIYSSVSKDFQYIGVDSSLSTLTLANSHRNLIQANSDFLPFPNDFFHIVLDGAALIHIFNWQNSLKEYARVTRKYIILHSISFSDNPENSYITKFAYGQKVSEIIFSKNLLLGECYDLNLELIKRFKGELYTAGNVVDFPIFSETWLLEKLYE